MISFKVYFLYILLNEGEVGIEEKLVNFVLQLEMRSMQFRKNAVTSLRLLSKQLRIERPSFPFVSLGLFCLVNAFSSSL